jgi:hypothetical protein
MNTTTLRQHLINLVSSSGGHKEQTDKYRSLLDQIFTQNENQIELLKLFIEASQ